MGYLPPAHTNRSPEEIIADRLNFESQGYLYRAVSWLDVARRKENYPSLLYACLEGRLGIEYLLFEQVVIGTGASLSPEEYERCVRERKLQKTLRRLVPDYKKLQAFTSVVASLDPEMPKLVFWDVRALMRDWGTLSEYLHWRGHRAETADDPQWVDSAIEEVGSILNPLWEKERSGRTGLLAPSGMHEEVREVWEQFRDGNIDADSVRRRLELMRASLVNKYRNRT